ncbi:MAG: hypothetical protein M1816_006022 [Peltula sp. TS41687]|nr:MAG: hypothetical protein M1816_006022 [Peltula sp. TS41687]
MPLVRVPRWDEYDINRRHDVNMWTFLGHGRIGLEVEAGRKGEGGGVCAKRERWDVEWTLGSRGDLKEVAVFRVRVAG